MAFSPLCRFTPGLFAPWLIRPLARSPLADLPPGLLTLCAWLIRPLACSLLADSPVGSFAPWLIRPLTLDDSLPTEYTSDSLLRLVFQFTEKQQVSVASRQ